MAVVIETTLGDFTVDLYTEERPQTCKNFLKLCKIKYYNFCLFHSVQTNFLAQTGDPTGSGTGGESIFGVVYGDKSRYYEAEKLPKLKHTRPGLLSMVNCGSNMLGSQFFLTLGSELQSLDEHCVFAEITEGMDILLKLNEAICDNNHRPYKDIRITHTVILEDPFEDPSGLVVPDASPEPSQLTLQNGRIGADEEIDETAGMTTTEVEEMKQTREAQARATILEIVGDIPDAEMAPPENVLFVCKLNPVTSDDDLEIIFSRFGKVKSCEVIRDHETGDSLQYAFIEFEEQRSCEEAYFKMDNVLIDDRRIHVDFSQSVAKMRWKGKGRGVEYLDKNEKSKPKPSNEPRNNTRRDRNGDNREHSSRDNRDWNNKRRQDEERHKRRDGDGDRRIMDKRRLEDCRKSDDRRRQENSRRWEANNSHKGSGDKRVDRDRRSYNNRSSRDEPIRGRKDKEPQRQDRGRENSYKDEKGLDKRSSHSRNYSNDQPREKSESSPVIVKSKENGVEEGKHTSRGSSSSSKDKIIKKESTNSPSASAPKLLDNNIMEKTDVDKNSKSEIKQVAKPEPPFTEPEMTSGLTEPTVVKKLKRKRKSSQSKHRKKRKMSSSSDSSSAASDSSNSSSSSESASSDHKRKHKVKTTVAKKYYHRGKLVKVVKKKKDTSESDSSSDSSSDSDRKRKRQKSKKHHTKKIVKIIEKRKKRMHSSDDTESDSSSSSDESDTERTKKHKRRKVSEKKTKKKKKKNSAQKKHKKTKSDDSSNSDESSDEHKSKKH